MLNNDWNVQVLLCKTYYLISVLISLTLGLQENIVQAQKTMEYFYQYLFMISI